MKRSASRQNVGPYGPDNPDPAPDVYSVSRQDGRFVVRHFPRLDAPKPCCTVTVTPEEGETEVDTLMRADRLCDEKHQARPRRATA